MEEVLQGDLRGMLHRQNVSFSGTILLPVNMNSGCLELVNVFHQSGLKVAERVEN